MEPVYKFSKYALFNTMFRPGRISTGMINRSRLRSIRLTAASNVLIGDLISACRKIKVDILLPKKPTKQHTLMAIAIENFDI